MNKQNNKKIRKKTSKFLPDCSFDHYTESVIRYLKLQGYEKEI